MHASLLTERFADTTVVVVGDAVLDNWVHGGAGRLCREAPVAVMQVTGEQSAAGGAANAAANAAALGSRVRFVSRVGLDQAGEELRSALRRHGVDDTYLVTDPAMDTPVKRRLVCDGQLLARYDQGQAGPPSTEVSRELAAALAHAVDGAAAVLVSDYGFGTFSPELMELLSGSRSRVPLVVDARELSPWAACSPTAVLPSFSEAVAVLDDEAASAGSRRADVIERNAGELLGRTGAEMVTVTLDGDGAILCRPGHPPYRSWTRPVPNHQATGAGDTFAAAFALAVAAGGQPADALDLAQAAASVVVGQVGTDVCGRDELLRHLGGGTGPLIRPGQLAQRLDQDRGRGRRIVFTNGCFDVLHRGHITLLQEARRLGDVLVVALNSDSSVNRLKGPGRPVNPLEDRAAVLGALGCVTYVTAFDDDTAEWLLERVRPDVYVKGGDYMAGMLPESRTVERLGGEVCILGYVENRSTTQLIERILQTGH